MSAHWTIISNENEVGPEEGDLKESSDKLMTLVRPGGEEIYS